MITVLFCKHRLSRHEKQCILAKTQPWEIDSVRVPEQLLLTKPLFPSFVTWGR